MRSETRFDRLAGPVEAIKPKATPSPMQVSRKKFLRRWIPFGVAMLREAEGLGIDVEAVRLESIPDLIHLYKQQIDKRREVA